MTLKSSPHRGVIPSHKVEAQDTACKIPFPAATVCFVWGAGWRQSTVSEPRHFSITFF